jgi:hypothetical protein
MNKKFSTAFDIILIIILCHFSLFLLPRMSTKEEKCMKIELTCTQLTEIERMQSKKIVFLVVRKFFWISFNGISETFEKFQYSY